MATLPQPEADRLTLAPVTADNWRAVAALEVTEAQRAFVAAPTYYLALCSFGGKWQPMAICLDDHVIGFVMWAVDPADGSCWMGGFIIDQQVQRQGHGRRALLKLMDLLGAEHGYRRFALSYEPDNPAAHLYDALGFRETGEREGDEVVARLWWPEQDATRFGLGRIWASRTRTLTWNLRVATPPDVTWGCFLLELWFGGAGIGPRPVVDQPGEPDGSGSTRRIGARERGVRERIVATEYPRRLEYRVMNPSWTTFPVDHHVGTVVFAGAENGGTEVRWRVELAPKRGAGPAVVAVTRYVIGRYLSALARACGSASAAPTVD